MALWVFASHVIQRVNGPNIFLVKGSIAVDVFMLISGILMVHNIYGRENKEPFGEPRTWLMFYVRRFFRIAPLYYAAFFFAIVFSAPISEMANALGGISSSNKSQLDNLATNIFIHLTFLFGMFPEWASSNVLPDWSLSLEMQFYALFPIILLFMRTSAVLFTVAAIAAMITTDRVVCVYRQVGECILFPQPSLLGLKITCFAAGMLLAHNTLRRPGRWVFWGSWLCFGSLVIINQRPTFSALAFGCAFMYWYSLNKASCDVIRKLHMIGDAALSCRPMRWLGDISYGVYLCHFFVILIVLHFVADFGFFDIESAWVRFALGMLLTAPLSLILAWVLYRTIEQPGMNIGKKISARLAR